jgi:phosphomannomutase
MAYPVSNMAAKEQRRYIIICRCALETGLASKGASIANCGLATTPAMFFSCVATGHQYDGGVMVTASHLPYNRNGLKFFTQYGGVFPRATT